MYLVKTKILKSPIEGKGYFADEDIPKGTIVYFYGENDRRYTKEAFEKLDKELKGKLLKYAVEDEYGNWVETGSGPYTNHSCDPNIMPVFISGFYTNIAVKNIKKGDEITLDYAQFFSSTKWTMVCKCGAICCRKTIGFGLKINLEVEKVWQSSLDSALKSFLQVKQPIYQSRDKYAMKIAMILKSIKEPTIAKYVKHVLISS